MPEDLCSCRLVCHHSDPTPGHLFDPTVCAGLMERVSGFKQENQPSLVGPSAPLAARDSPAIVADRVSAKCLQSF